MNDQTEHSRNLFAPILTVVACAAAVLSAYEARRSNINTMATLDRLIQSTYYSAEFLADGTLALQTGKTAPYPTTVEIVPIFDLSTLLSQESGEGASISYRLTNPPKVSEDLQTFTIPNVRDELCKKRANEERCLEQGKKFQTRVHYFIDGQKKTTRARTQI